MRFHRIEGPREILRAILARAREAEATTDGLLVKPPWSKALLDGIGLDAADVLVVDLSLSSGRTATVLVQIAPLNHLFINSITVAPSNEDGHPPSAPEEAEAVSKIVERLLVPAFEACPGASMVIERDGEVVRLGPARK